MMQSNY